MNTGLVRKPKHIAEQAHESGRIVAHGIMKRYAPVALRGALRKLVGPLAQQLRHAGVHARSAGQRLPRVGEHGCHLAIPTRVKPVQ